MPLPLSWLSSRAGGRCDRCFVPIAAWPSPHPAPHFPVRLATSAAPPASRPVRPAASCDGRQPLRPVPRAIYAASRMPPPPHRPASTTTHVGHRRDKRAAHQWVPSRDASLFVPHAPLRSLSPVIPTPHRTQSALTPPTQPFISSRNVHRCPRVAACQHPLESLQVGGCSRKRLADTTAQRPPSPLPPRWRFLAQRHRPQHRWCRGRNMVPPRGCITAQRLNAD